jgi:hypothetical protein
MQRRNGSWRSTSPASRWARVEHVFARIKTWKILRDCRRNGDEVHDCTSAEMSCS